MTMISGSARMVSEVGSQPSSLRRIAILGGGVGSLSAAFALTEDPDWRNKYEITVYQMGWRLGGKGASSRNAVHGQRIEEHGLHIWFGFYDNAFRMMQKAYAECDALKLMPDTPFKTCFDAFKPHNCLTAMEVVDGKWKPWPIDYPVRPGLPGEGEEQLSPALYFRLLIRWIRRHVHDTALPSDGLGNKLVWCLNRLILQSLARRASGPVDALVMDGALTEPVIILLDRYRARLKPVLSKDFRKDEDLRRKLELLDLVLAITRGTLADRVLTRGFDAIDEYDAREWLERHNCSFVNSSMVRGMYGLVFAYVNGDPGRPNLGAGTALRAILRIVLTYKGSVLYKMQAGMGETVFSPLYLMLKARGVSFRFFHKVTHLGVSPDGRSVERIEFDLQARVKAEVELSLGGYQPLRDVRGIPCWPEAPFYEQLVHGDQLQAALEQHGQTLESNWWAGAADKLVLHQGVEFDDVIVGIPIGSLPFIASELIDTNPRFGQMVELVPTVETQAFQVWMSKSIEELGWLSTEPAIVGAFAEPIDTWADLSHLATREDWLPEANVKNIAYFCAALECPDIAPLNASDYPGRRSKTVKRNSIEFLSDLAGVLWPKTGSTAGGGFDWELLVDRENRIGSARFDAQYWRANVDPGERYVLSVKGSTKYRLRSDESGFDNVFLAGDWTYNGINLGCVEAAAISGLQAGKAISGYPKVIYGEEPMNRRPSVIAIARENMGDVDDDVDDPADARRPAEKEAAVESSAPTHLA